jgi:transcriptional regulator with XRE-family HTH domain
MDNEKMGQFISELRKSQQMTQKELAEKLNVSDKAVSKWERGLSYPDISLLSPLSDILGITTTELLNGEKAGAEIVNVEESVVNALDYGEKTVKRKLNISHQILGAAFTIILLIGIVVVSIVNVAISRTFTWSLIPISACVFTWLIFYPVIKRGSKGIFGSFVSLSVLIIPFLIVLEVAIERTVGYDVSVFAYGIRIAPLAIAYLWAGYFLCRKYWASRKLFVIAILILLASPLNYFTNTMVDAMLGQRMIDIVRVLNALSTAVVGVIMLIVEFVLRRRE